jgi:hypothetical protein
MWIFGARRRREKDLADRPYEDFTSVIVPPGANAGEHMARLAFERWDDGNGRPQLIVCSTDSEIEAIAEHLKKRYVDRNGGNIHAGLSEFYKHWTPVDAKVVADWDFSSETNRNKEMKTLAKADNKGQHGQGIIGGPWLGDPHYYYQNVTTKVAADGGVRVMAFRPLREQ